MVSEDQLLEYGKITKGRYKYHSQLYVKDDLVTKSGRVLVPASLWFQIASQVHNRNHWGYITTYNNIAKKFIGLVRENGIRTKSPGQNLLDKIPLGQNPPGQNPPSIFYILLTVIYFINSSK